MGMVEQELADSIIIFASVHAVCQMLTKETIRTKLRETLPRLQEKYPIEKLALFGSYSRDEQNDNSDIDILVEFNGNIGWEFFDLADELKKILGQKVDLVSRRGIKPHYWEFIHRDILYV